MHFGRKINVKDLARSQKALLTLYFITHSKRNPCRSAVVKVALKL